MSIVEVIMGGVTILLGIIGYLIKDKQRVLESDVKTLQADLRENRDMIQVERGRNTTIENSLLEVNRRIDELRVDFKDNFKKIEDYMHLKEHEAANDRAVMKTFMEHIVNKLKDKDD